MQLLTVLKIFVVRLQPTETCIGPNFLTASALGGSSPRRQASYRGCGGATRCRRAVSGWTSVTFMYCIEMSKHVVKLFNILVKPSF